MVLRTAGSVLCCSVRGFAATALCVGLVNLLAVYVWLFAEGAAAPPRAGETSPVLVSSHGGAKFWGVRLVLRWNKALFCKAEGLSCAIDWAVPDESQHPMRAKYSRMLAALEAFPAASGVVWVDGDTWLWTPARQTFVELLQRAASWDMFFGRDMIPERFALPPTSTGVCNEGVNAGVFWVRQTQTSVEWLHFMFAQLVKERSDQCVVNKLFASNSTFVQHASYAHVNDSGIFQCRMRCDFDDVPKSLCCTPDSWLVHWPAHDRNDLLLRILEQELGTTLVTDGARLAERLLCALGLLAPKSLACRERVPLGITAHWKRIAKNKMVCSDFVNWTDSRGEACTKYEGFDECELYGHWAERPPGRPANIACCACGGGERTSPRTV